MHAIDTNGAPRPAGHYSQGMAHGGMMFIAGQLPLDPDTGAVVGTDIETQTERTLRNIEAVLQAAGTDLQHLLSVTVYLTGRSLWSGFNTAYARMLGEHRPARAVIPVPELKPGCLVEIQAVAALPAQGG